MSPHLLLVIAYLLLDHLSVMLASPRLALLALGTLLLIHVAHGHHLDLWIAQKGPHVTGALNAQPDNAKREAFRGGYEAGPAQGSARNDLTCSNYACGCGGLDKVPASNRVLHKSNLVNWICWRQVNAKLAG